MLVKQSLLKDSKLQHPIKNFTYSLDIKGFVKDKDRTSPYHANSQSFYKKSEKIRTHNPSPLAMLNFSKNVSQKNMQARRKLSAGFSAMKTNNHSVSLDKHLLKHKYERIKELFIAKDYLKTTSHIKHVIHHFENGNSQRNLYYWLTYSLLQSQKYEEALQELIECNEAYPNFEEGLILLGKVYYKIQNHKQGVDSFLKVIKINAKCIEAYCNLFQGYVELKDKLRGMEILRKGVQKCPKSEQILTLLVEELLQQQKLNECEQLISKFKSESQQKSSSILYLKGRIEMKKQNEEQSYILFEEALKFNSNRIAVTKSLLEMLKIEIHRRDFYKAYHTISRTKFYDIEAKQEIDVYSSFIEGVILMMKKKYQDSITILAKVLLHKRTPSLNIANTIHKYLGYGYFKLGQHDKSIKFYNKIAKPQIDQSSLYNLLLAEGIEMVDRSNQFEGGINKFNEAKQVYPAKVEPYIYIAMTYIKKENINAESNEEKTINSMIQALRQLEEGERLNSSSSNLLYHRTIIHLYFEDWEEAFNDINRCIEKAEQNLPKYFYLRGVYFSCVKQFKKAINEYSICISLAGDYGVAYLQRAKCYFLLGDTEKGFGSLKVFMELNPQDMSIYKWIGSLLYEGCSYRDALKAYQQLGNTLDIDILVVKIKCHFRNATINDISAHFKALQKHSQSDQLKVSVDITAFALLQSLIQNDSFKSLNATVKKLNDYLEQNIVGYVFQLIDCMNLLGVASFYLEKYLDAYESFLLVLELYRSLNEKNQFPLKSENSDEDLDLKVQDIYMNIIISEFAQGNFEEGRRMLAQEYKEVQANSQTVKKMDKVLKLLQSEGECVEMEMRVDKPFNLKLKKVELVLADKRKMRCKPSFNLYHDSIQDLYASCVAQKLVRQLHAGYIDDMPEAPWIKRNTHGVIFTEDVTQQQNSITFEDSSRLSESRGNGDSEEDNESSSRKQVSKREEFLKNLKFDSKVEAKLNSLIDKTRARNHI